MSLGLNRAEHGGLCEDFNSNPTMGVLDGVRRFLMGLTPGSSEVDSAAGLPEH